MKIDRRSLLATAACVGGAMMLDGCRCPFCGDGARVPYDGTIGDRLWMWGHHPMSFASMKNAKEGYNLPYDRRIDMADACRDMNIPGCFVVRWRNLPTKAELPEYMKQFGNTRRVGFSITDSAKESFDEKVRFGLELADEMPNLTTLVMDDYWAGVKQQSVRHLRETKVKIAEKGLKLSVVLYSDSNGVKAEFKDVLDVCDEVTFWFWHGKNVGGIEAQVAKLRDLIGPEKPVLLGQYMWDFGGKKPMSAEYMREQLAATSRLLARKEIAGVIFHCTPLVDMNLDAVNISREWIRQNASRAWGT